MNDGRNCNSQLVFLSVPLKDLHYFILLIKCDLNWDLRLLLKITLGLQGNLTIYRLNQCDCYDNSIK